MKPQLLFLCFLFHFVSSAQTVRGVVRSGSTNEPLTGATLHIPAQRLTTVSNNSGAFILKDVRLPATLQISFSGYQLKEVTLTDTSFLQLALIPAPGTLEEVVVNTGYQKLPVERVTGSFNRLGTALLNEQVSTSILERLEAIGNGVSFDRRTIQSTASIQIRGLSTIQGPKAPLVVVDNFPYEGDISNLNPNDVESITLLKDAAAASIWGTRAGNGVIVITTKKGRFNQPLKMSFNSSITVQEKPDLFYLPTMSSADFVEVEKFLFSKGYRFSDTGNTARPPFSPAYEILFAQRNGRLSAADANAQLEALKGRDLRSDFLQYVYKPAIRQQYALNLSGGGPGVAWLLSGGWDRNQSNVDAGLRRTTLRSETTVRPFKNFELTSSIFLAQTKSTGGRVGYVEATSSRLPPYAQLADAAGNPLAVVKSYRQPYLDTAGGGKLLDWNYYPLAENSLVQRESQTRDVVLNLGLQYKLTPFLQASFNYQYQRADTRAEVLQDETSYVVRDLVNNFTQLNRATGVATYRIPKGAILDISQAVVEAHQGRAGLELNRHWKRHDLRALAGVELRQTIGESNSYRTYGYNPSVLTSVPVDYATPYATFLTGSTGYIPNNTGFSHTNNRFVSLYSNLAYTYLERYTFSLSGRRDASNLFGVATNDRWTPLWSGGLGWELSKERFYKLATLPYLRLRLTYGVSGNVDPTKSAYTTISYFSTSVYTLGPTAIFDKYANPELRWERAAMLNAGLDFRLKGARISGSIEYYHKRSTDLYGNTPVDYTAVSTDNLVKNVASMMANGWDIELNSVNTNTVFRWTTTLNASFYKDKVTDYYQSSQQGSLFLNGGFSPSAIVGRPVYAVYAYQWAGLDPQTGDPRGYLKGAVSKDYTALTGATTLINDLAYKGPAFPTAFGSLGNTFSYKGLSLSVRLLYKLGFYFMKPSVNYTQLFSTGLGHPDYALRWQKPGDENQTSVPSLVYPAVTSRENFYNNSEVLARKGDYLRLQYITLTYAFPSRLLRPLKMSGLECYLNATNLGLLWRANKDGLDPEYRATALPVSRSIAFGIRGNF